jgi:hypothetical protein
LGALAELAEESVAASRLAVSEGRSKAASEFANVASRALDKAQLLGVIRRVGVSLGVWRCIWRVRVLLL